MAKRTISKLASDASVGVETIRYYERAGLLKQPHRNLHGWREYGEDAVWTVRYIRHAQELGFKLREIKQLLTTATTEQSLCQSIRASVRGKLQECLDQIETLQSRRIALEEFIAVCAARPESDGCPIARNLGLGVSITALKER